MRQFRQLTGEFPEIICELLDQTVPPVDTTSYGEHTINFNWSFFQWELLIPRLSSLPGSHSHPPVFSQIPIYFPGIDLCQAMNGLEAALLGSLQGLVEWLPLSSKAQ
ncbi:MAG: hypothetical protein LUQ67_06430, partial [Methanomicrobiales archaeon]|nr:hypothetical protein [Methanomicrobiales archaeon]